MGLAQIDPKSHTNFAGFQAAGMVLKNQTAPPVSNCLKPCSAKYFRLPEADSGSLKSRGALSAVSRRHRRGNGHAHRRRVLHADLLHRRPSDARLRLLFSVWRV